MLAFILFGVALDLKPEDFKRIFQAPRAVLTGFFSQYIFLPLLTLAMIAVFKPQPSLALGMILVAVCPGGNISNFMTHLARGNIALSVTLTSTTTLAAIILTPLTFPSGPPSCRRRRELRATIFVEPQQMFKTILQLIFVPVVLGMGAKIFPKGGLLAAPAQAHPFPGRFSSCLSPSRSRETGKISRPIYRKSFCW
ncbi:MAG: bile acid:sodium symporter [Saprospirales bacterium]|nr:bile acid:sodium symporter [Saprospirales bacterium]